MKNIFIIFVTILISYTKGFSQYQTIYDFNNHNFYRYSIDYSDVIGDQLIMFVNGNDEDGSENDPVLISDGTTEGTRVICNEDCRGFKSNFIKLHQDLLFTIWNANDKTYTLWKVDTNSNISPLKVFNAYGVASDGRALINRPSYFVQFKDLLYFTASDGIVEKQLWRSDGTSEGTYPVYTFPNPETHRVSSLMAGENRLFFTVQENHADVNKQLWVSNGESGGTYLVKNFSSFSINAAVNIGYKNSAIIDDVIYFAAHEKETGRELWKSDGTEAGTQMIKDLTPGQNLRFDSLAASSDLRNFFSFQNQVYFIKRNYENNQIWLTDGTEEGTRIINEYPHDYDLNQFVRLGDFMIFNQKLFLVMDDGHTGYELWVKNQDSGSFNLLKDIRTGKTSSFEHFEGFEYKNELYFTANDGQYGFELWKTDGTTENTQIFADLSPGISWTFPNEFIAKPVLIGNQLMFFTYAQDGKILLNTLNLDAEVAPPEPLPEFAENEWFRSIGILSRSNSIFPVWNDEVITDSQNNVYVSGKSNTLYPGLEFFDNQRILYENPGNESNGNFIAKYDKRGNLHWAKHVGGNTAFESNTLLALSPKENLIIANTFSQTAGFDSLRLNPRTETMYLAEYTSQGQLEWIKTIHTRGRFNKIQTDSNGNIYVGGLYWGFGVGFGNEINLESDVSPQYFVAKFDPQGNAIWANNIDHVGDSYGKLADLKVGHDGRIFTLLTQGTIHTASSCRFQSWGINVQSYRPNGSPIWSKTFQTNDLSIARSLDVSPLGDIFLVGLFRGTLTLDGKTMTTKYLADGCNRMSSFLIRLDDRDGSLIHMKHQDFDFAFVHQILFDKEGNYFLLGSEYEANASEDQILPNGNFPNQSNYYFVRKFDVFGNLLQERKIYFHSYARELNPRMALDSENYVILSGMYKGQFDDTPNSILEGYAEKMFVMRFKQIEEHFDSFPEKFTEGITLAPNPTNGLLYLISPEEELRNFDLKVYNVHGQVVNHWKKTGKNTFSRIDLSLLPQGMYILKFTNGERQIIKKVVKK